MKQVTLIITAAITVEYDENLTDVEVVENEVIDVLKNVAHALDEYVDLPVAAAKFRGVSVSLFETLPTFFKY